MEGEQKTEAELQDLLAIAIQLAIEMHGSRKDKSGELYILHPMRVMMAVKGTEEKIVAIMHDLMEDEGLTRQKLEEKGFPDYIIVALESVSCLDPDEEYDHFVRRAIANPIGRQVKIADIQDNSNIFRHIEMREEKSQKMLLKYLKAIRVIEQEGKL